MGSDMGGFRDQTVVNVREWAGRRKQNRVRRLLICRRPSISRCQTESTPPCLCSSGLRVHLLTHRRPPTHVFFPFEHCGCLSARLIVERWHENPWLTGLVLPLTLSRPVKGLLFCLSFPRAATLAPEGIRPPQWRANCSPTASNELGGT